MYIISTKKGFTLIEILIYIAVLGLIMFSFLSYVIIMSGSKQKAYVSEEVHSNLRQAFNVMNQKIKVANDVLTPMIGNSSDSLTLNSSTGQIVFSITGGVLKITENGETFSVTSDEVVVSNLLFTNLTPQTSERDNISIEITIDYKGGGGVTSNYTQSARTAVTLRN